MAKAISIRPSAPSPTEPYQNLLEAGRAPRLNFPKRQKEIFSGHKQSDGPTQLRRTRYGERCANMRCPLSHSLQAKVAQFTLKQNAVSDAASVVLNAKNEVLLNCKSDIYATCL